MIPVPVRFVVGTTNVSNFIKFVIERRIAKMDTMNLNVVSILIFSKVYHNHAVVMQCLIMLFGVGRSISQNSSVLLLINN